MEHKQGGFTFPFVIILAGAFLTVALFSIEQFTADKKFYKEGEEKLALDHLIKMGTNDTLEVLAEADSQKAGEGIFFYPGGDVYYSFSGLTESEIEVVLYASTKNERKMTASYIYDRVTHKMIQWM
ncbi:competence type IV pilus minor pilin ComGG [Peribacillus sp. SCS-155]|uniref:competence type IV pilus minor pilin ComGG n=1 Tax=Peribacillus sedimenti TaxID=3115297 RepID=UPI00390683D5